MEIFDQKLTIEGKTVTAQGIANALFKYYPSEIQTVINTKLYGYVMIFGIRVETCDTSAPDDFIGAIRFKWSPFGDDNWELLISNATVDPSPYYLSNPMSDAKSAGGTAWVKEGQYLFYSMGIWKGEPAFAPVKPIDVYRWNPKFEGEEFSAAKAVLSKSPDTLIHRSWSRDKMYNDSAGCQVFKDNSKLELLNKWAMQHKKSKYGNYFSYTLFTKEQFLSANEKEENNYYKFPVFNF